MQPRDNARIFSQQRSGKALAWLMGFCLLLVAGPGWAAEQCDGLATKDIGSPLTPDTTCTVTEEITVLPDVIVPAGDTLSLYAPVVGIPIGPFTVENQGRLRIVSISFLNDTGITWGGDYLDGNNATCTSNIAAPQDCHQGRDASANDDSDGHAGFSFTKLDASGNPLPPGATSWSCVKDNVTGLIWEVKTTDGGIHDKDNSYRWGGVTAQGSGYGTYYNDWDMLVNGSNAEQLCGYNDWRVPTVEELQGIVDYSRAGPAIDTGYFPNTPSSFFWSSSLYAGFSSGAWSVYFGYGYAYGNCRDSADRVRLVRSGS